MGNELAYTILTPHTVRKGRLGAVLSQLLSRVDLDLVSAGLFQASSRLAKDYAATLEDSLVGEYVRREFPFDRDHDSSGNVVDRHDPRTLLLVFRGPEAAAKLASAIGVGLAEADARGTVRGVFGDHVTATDGSTLFFEPAALVAPDAALAQHQLQLWLDASDRDLMRPVTPLHGEEQRTLVLLKPDNFRFPSTRPGALMGVFARAGLLLESFKIHHMSLEEATEFYRDVLPALEDLYRQPGRSEQTAGAVSHACDLPLSSETGHQLGQLAAPLLGRAHWENLIAFMTGSRPSEVPPDQHSRPGSQKIIALVYRGIDAVSKIRATLGPTDPSKAPPGTVRREFGQTMMINAAHASDSTASAAREIGLLGLERNHLLESLERHQPATAA